MTIAPLWRRLAAMFYDSIMLIAIWMVVGFLVTALFGIDQSRSVHGAEVELNPYYQYAMLAAMLTSAYLFFGWFWTHSGQTIGMQAWKIKVQNANGARVSWQQVSLRYVSAPLALAAAGLGYWWMLFDPQRRCWPDMASGSVVVLISNFPPSAS